MDRLPDEFWTDGEIAAFDKEVLATNSYNDSEPIQKYICVYEMYTPKGNTGVVVIVNTDTPEIMQETLARDWSHTSMSPMLGNMGELEWNSDAKLQALYTVLHKHKFNTDIEAKSNDRLYKWQKWMKNLL